MLGSVDARLIVLSRLVPSRVAVYEAWVTFPNSVIPVPI